MTVLPDQWNWLVRHISQLEAKVAYLEAQEGVPVVATYTTDAGQSISNATWTIIDFEDQVIDTHSAVTTGASWHFTAPIGGIYVVSACIMFAQATDWGETEFAQLAAYRASTHYRLLSRPAGADFSGAAQYLAAHGMAVIDMTASQELSIRVNQQSGATQTIHNSYSYNHVSIFRVMG
jgi:hypothetical protein